jgi:hypothetical protein
LTSYFTVAISDCTREEFSRTTLRASEKLKNLGKVGEPISGQHRLNNGFIN